MMMDHRVFSPKLRILSTVPRWSVIPTTRPDHVSSHSFYVAVYARQIARIIEWPGPMDQLLWAALMHDQDEMFSGDLIGYVKRAIVDQNRLDSFVAGKLDEHFPDDYVIDHEYVDGITRIIKAADLMDAHFFVLHEKMLGNRVMATREESTRVELYAAWLKLPGFYHEGRSKLLLLFDEFVVPAAEAHAQPESYSI